MFPNNFAARVLRTTALLAGLSVVLLGQTTPPNSFVVTNLVASTAGTAQITDPNLLDPWGMSISGTSPFWVSNHLSGTSTLYNGSGVITPTVVKIAPGAASGAVLGRPTGQVFNAGAGFILPSGTKASFIFDTEDGTVQGWSSGAASVMLVDNSAAGAVYKGLATATSALGQTLYAANFRSGNIDVFDSTFKPATLAGGFKNTAIPAGFAPFNIWPIGTTMYVMYAKQDAAKFADTPGTGNGYVAAFDFNGNLQSTLVSGGVLNSPFGVAIAPAGWGPFGGALIVGNFGDGTVNAFDAKAGTLLGTLQNTSGAKIQLAGLWALLFGNGGRGGDVNTLYFVAGNPTPPPGGGTAIAPRGILGSIAPPAAIKQVLSAASFTAGSVAPGELVTILGQSVGLSPSVAAVIPTSGFLGTQLQQPGTTFTARVTVNGINAPLIYSNGNQTSVQVPYAVAGLPSADFVITANGQTTDKFTVPVVPTAPGLFTSNVTGSGQVVAFNQDGTLNSTANAAAKGSFIQLYATGEGVVNPNGIDGFVQSGYVRVPAGAVSVSIGGSASSPATFAGSIPGLLTGLTLVEAQIPAATATGAVPVVLTIAGASSPAGATISVK
jgi:uncharacterized protein (TIGR03118 family)